MSARILDQITDTLLNGESIKMQDILRLSEVHGNLKIYKDVIRHGVVVEGAQHFDKAQLRDFIVKLSHIHKNLPEE